MIVLGVTGGIGSGKSVVCRMFETLGIPVYNADTRAKMLMETDAPLMEQIKNLLGQEAYKDGVLDRKWVASKVFNNGPLIAALNAIVHPAVAIDFENWRMQQHDVPFIIKEAAILFESGAVGQTDKVATVNAPEALRIQRTIERDGRTAEEVKEIIAKQMSDTERAAKSKYVITNDDQTPLLPQVLLIYEKLKRS